MLQQILAHQTNVRKIGSCLNNLRSSQFIKTNQQRNLSSLLIKPQNQKQNLLINNDKLVYFSLNNSLQKRNFISSSFLGLWGSKKQPEIIEIKNNTEPVPSPPEVTNIPNVSNQAELSQVTNTDIYANTGYIPEPPAIIDENIILNALGEPTLQSLGLGSYYFPTGWIQLIIEFSHVELGLEWYQAIILFAFILRTSLFPITVKAQKNAVALRKIGPISNKIRDKINEAKLSGDSLKVARATHEYTMLMKENKMGLGSMLLPVAQIPFMISTFLAIRKMCNFPVESMKDGGALWFRDLTIADPFYILPTVSVLGILAVVYRGIDTGIGLKDMTPFAKALVFGMSALSYPFLLFMPSGIMIYFCTTNFISLLISYIVNNDSIKKALKIPILTPNQLREIKESQKKSKNFFTEFQESIQNQKIINEVKERERLREQQFMQAGTRVPQKTFKTNPKNKTNE